MRTKVYKWMLVLFFTMTGVAGAQQTDEMKKEINRVKKSTLYLYAETTMSDKEEALSTAMEMLEKEVQRWVQTQRRKDGQESDLVLTNIGRISNKMELPRGDMYRAFVYIKKSDVIVSRNTKVAKMEETDSGELPDGEFRSHYEPVGGTVVEIYPEAVQRLLVLAKFEEIEPCLSALKREGKVKEYGRYASLPDPSEYMLVIYNRNYKVVAVLNEGKERMNLKTNRPDSVANYKGCGAVGVKLVK